MTQEDKELLLKDLCARLQYKPKALINGHLATILGIDENVIIVCIYGNDYKYEIVVSVDNSDDVKLYLRPMSSMTKEEKEEYHKLCDSYDGIYFDSVNSIDWLNKHHFDYRGLVPKNLAIAVIEENNPYKLD